MREGSKAAAGIEDQERLASFCQVGTEFHRSILNGTVGDTDPESSWY